MFSITTIEFFEWLWRNFLFLAELFSHFRGFGGGGFAEVLWVLVLLHSLSVFELQVTHRLNILLRQYFLVESRFMVLRSTDSDCLKMAS